MEPKPDFEAMHRAGAARPDVLVVDDEHALSTLIVRMLEHHALRASSATDYEQAMAHLARSGSARVPPSAVVLDHGVERSSELCRHASELGIPVVLISGDRLAADDPELSDCPPSFFLPKPFTLEQIGRTVRQALRSCADGAA